MKQLSQFFVLSSLSFLSASASQDLNRNDEPAFDVPAEHPIQAQAPERHMDRKPAVEPRVYVQDEKTGELYYYDYPKQESHAKQNPPEI